MPSLNASEQQIVQSVCPGFTIHTTAIVRFYKGNENGEWEQYAMGAAALVSNSVSHYLKVVDLNSSNVAFSQEFYNNFDYQSARPFFHVFEIDDCVAGFSFADESEANEFLSKVNKCKQTPASAMVGESSSSSHHASPLSQHSMSSPNLNAPSSPESRPRADSVKKKKGNAFKGLLNKAKEGAKGLFNNDETPDDFLISEPRNFRHESSIGWNPDSGFEIRNIPPEWRKLFQAAGIKKSELKNKDTAAFVMNVIEQNGGIPPAPAPPPAPPAPPPPGSFDSHSYSPAPPSGPPPAPTGRAALLASIQQGANLRKAEERQSIEAPIAPSAPPPSGLADTLARAMDARRAAIKEDGAREDEEEEWSDEDWE